MHIEGHYTILLTRNGVTDEYAFCNLIMDDGLAVLRGYMSYQGEWFSTAPGYSVKLSTDNSTPVVTETAWPLAVADSVTIVDRGFGQNTTVQPYYSEWSIAAEFAANAYVGDVHSVVVTANYRGTATAGLFSRALLRNRLGDIAPLTLIPGDQVTILYRQRIYPNLAQTSGAFVKSSVTYDWVSNPVKVDQPGGALSSLSLPVAGASYSQFPKGVLTYDRSIICCLNFEGTNGASPVNTLDESGFGNTIAFIGSNPVISTAQAKFGSSSLYLDGTGDYAKMGRASAASYHPGMMMRHAPTTVSCWVRFPTWAHTTNRVASLLHPSGSYHGWYMSVDNTGSGVMSVLASNTNQLVLASPPGTIPLNQWCHLAISHNGAGGWTLMVNGAVYGRGYYVLGNATHPTHGMFIGTISGDGVNDTPNMHLDNFVVATKQLWDPTITVPTTAFPVDNTDPYWANVSLRVPFEPLNQNFVDVAKNYVGVYGNAKLSSAQTLYGATAIALDGTGDYLTAPPVQPALGNGDFTAEFWIYIPTLPSAYKRILGCQVVGSGAVGAASEGIIFEIDTANRMTFVISTGAAFIGVTDPTALLPSTWYHYAAVRSGATITLYRSGAPVVSTSVGTSSVNVPTNSSMHVGRHPPDVARDFNGNLADLRITQGVARYTATFTPPTAQLTLAGDPYAANVVLLLTGDGVNNSTFIENLAPKTPMVINGVPYLTDVRKKYGTTSGYFSGTDTWVSGVSQAVTTTPQADFTVEFWVYVVTATAKTQTMFNVVDGTYNGLHIHRNTGGTLTVDNGATGTPAGSVAIPLNTWTHVAVVRSGSVITAYVDGAQCLTHTAQSYGTAVRWQAGRYGTATGTGDANTNLLNGYLADLRVTKGLARYTSTFTPPTQAFTTSDADFDKVVLQMSFDGTASKGFHDVSSNALPPTITSATVSPTTTKFGSGALYLPGSAYISYPHHANLILNGDFTIEVWVYPTSRPTMACILDKDGLSGSYYASYFIGVRNTGHVAYALGSVDATGTYEGTLTVPLNEWTHIAMVVSGPRVMGFVNGKLDACASVMPTYVDRGQPLSIGYSQGQPIAANTFVGYIDDLRITKGVARYTADYTVPTAPILPNNAPTATYPSTGGLLEDPYINNVVLHCPFNGTPGDYANLRTTPPIMLSQYTGTYSTAPITSAVNNGYQSSSAYFPATRVAADGTDVPAFRDSDFTIEAWIMHPGAWDGAYTASNDRTIYGDNSAVNYQTYVGLVSNTGELSYWDNATNVKQSTGPYITPGQWAHIAVCRAQRTIYLYVNGVMVGSGAVSAYHANQPTAYIMGDAGYGNRNFTGYISDLRITQGIARYVGTGFTPARVQGVFPSSNPAYPATVSVQGVVGGQYQLSVAIPTGPSIADGAGGIAMYNSPAAAPQYTYPHGVWSQMLFEGVDGQAVFTDTGYVGTSWTPTGVPALTTAQSKFGTTSLYLDGASYLRTTTTTHRAQLTSNFTVMAWVRLAAYTSGGYCPILTAGSDAGSTAYTHLSVTTTGGLRARGWSGSADMFNVVSPDAFVLLDTWTHVAFIRAGTTITLYVNGVSVASGVITLPNVPQCGTSNLHIGRGWNGSATVNMTGYIDSLTISSGVEYTANFTPPTIAYTVPDYAGEAPTLLDSNSIRQVAAFTPSLPKASSDSYDIVMGGTVARYD